MDNAKEYASLVANGAVLDTLVALIERGPLDDGSVPSKRGRDTLIAHGCAQRVIMRSEDGYTAATLKGADLYRYAFGNADTLKQAAERRTAERAIANARTIQLKQASVTTHAECTHCTNVRLCKAEHGCAAYHGINLWG
jgi:hypothetical protein